MNLKKKKKSLLEEKVDPREVKAELKKTKRMNREMATVTYIFMILFVVMAGYVIWFLFSDTDQILNNPSNKRQELLAERVTKGSILSDRKKVLAETITSESGNDHRVYPYDGLFAHVVGRSTHGKTGLESSESYTMLTTGINPLVGIINECKGEKNPGNNVVTTLNVKLSKVASDALGSHKGAVVVMDPQTGKIITMVSKPTYNPNNVESSWNELISNSSDESALYNRATQGLYPPGSTFKLYTLLEYMRENKSFSKFQYTCTGKIGHGKDSIRCYGHEVHGTIGLSRAFAKSCNAAFAQIGSSLNPSKWTDLCNSLYFNRTLEMKELEQKSSQFKVKEAAGSGDVMQVAIGQGSTLITPLQNAYLVSAACNDGTLMKPYLVDYIEDTYGNVLEKNDPVKASSPLTEEEAKVLRKYMRETVESGTATALISSNYKAGGKTGSAEFKEGSTDSHAWFVGYAQKGDRKLVVSIIVEGAGTGSAYAVPIARRIFDTYYAG